MYAIGFADYYKQLEILIAPNYIKSRFTIFTSLGVHNLTIGNRGKEMENPKTLHSLFHFCTVLPAYCTCDYSVHFKERGRVYSLYLFYLPHLPF